MAKKRVLLVVDNPLRDLDGLVLLALSLAKSGVDAWLVPMYDQVFDVSALKPDLILINYLRFNNESHVLAYLASGFKVGVLDTEGVGGKSANEFSALVGVTGKAKFLDLYCVWGSAQQNALSESRLLGHDGVFTTGCPRYDYCAEPWRNALKNPATEPGYILVNTNFPVVNPRFSSGESAELETAVKAGFSREFAEAYIRDAKSALQGVLSLMETLLARLPTQKFVLRPHPFESRDPYRPLERFANFEIRQEGTSIQWLNRAKALIHLNCSTAVEAAMIGVPALTPAWLDTPSLNVPGPHSVSQHLVSVEAMAQALAQVAETKQAGALPEALHSLYHHIDGRASERVAEAILATLKRPPTVRELPRPGFKARWVHRARKVLGYRCAQTLASWRVSSAERARREAKLFSCDEVSDLLDRLQACDPAGPRVVVKKMAEAPGVDQRLASQHSLLITAS